MYDAVVVVAGDPRPSVKWWRKGKLYDESYDVREDGLVINDLEIDKLSAEDLLSVLTCQASNSEAVNPLEASILIDITRKLILSLFHPLLRLPLVLRFPVFFSCRCSCWWCGLWF